MTDLNEFALLRKIIVNYLSKNILKNKLISFRWNLHFSICSLTSLTNTRRQKELTEKSFYLILDIKYLV